MDDKYWDAESAARRMDKLEQLLAAEKAAHAEILEISKGQQAAYDGIVRELEIEKEARIKGDDANTLLRRRIVELERDVQVIRGQYQGACDVIKQLENAAKNPA